MATSSLIARATLPVTLLVQAGASAAMLAPAVAAPRLLAQLGAGTVAVGLYIAGVYFAAMFSSQMGAVLVRRWGPIRTSQAALLACAVGLLLVSTALLPLAIVGTFLIGLGYGPITPASSEMLARTTPPEKYALVFSVKQTGVPLGGALSGLLIPVVLNTLGVAWALAQIAALCVLGIALAQLLRNQLDALRNPLSPLPTFARIMQPVRFVFEHPLLRRVSLCTLVFSMVQVSLMSYLVSFLNLDLGWSLVAAGAALSVAQAAGATGRILWGLLADRLHDGSRLTLLGLAGAMLLCGLLMSLLQAATGHGWVITLLAVYGGTAIGWNGVVLAAVARLVAREQAAMATAGSLFFTFFGVVIGPALFGVVGGILGSLGGAFALLALPLCWALWAMARTKWDTAAGQAGSGQTHA